MKKNKKLVTSILATLALGAIGGGVLCISDTVSASAATNGYVSWDGKEVNQQFNVAGEAEQISFYTSTGASIRYTDPTGMRFTCTVALADYNRLVETYGKDSVSFGALITQKEVLGDAELTHDFAGQKMDAVATNNSLTDSNTENDDVFQFNAVIKSMNAVNYGKEYIARSYVKVTVEGTSYYGYNEYDEVKHSRSVKSVALDALANADAELSNERKDILRGFISGLQADDANLKTVTYDLQGGEGKAKSGFLSEEGLTTLATPYKVGYTFDGWYDSQDGLVTSIPTGSDSVTLTAKWTEKTIAANMLVDFDEESSTSHIKQTYNGYLTKEDPAAVWLSEFEGATGVVKTQTGNRFTPRYGQSKLAVNTERTEDELRTMLNDFDFINVRMYIEGDKDTYDLYSQNLPLATVKSNEWVDLKITSDMITSDNPTSHYMNYASTNTGLDGFAKLHSSTNFGNYLFFVHLQGELPAEYTSWAEFQADSTKNEDDKTKYELATEATRGVTVYLDSISVAKFSVEETTLTKGVETTVPALTMTGFGGEAMDIEDVTTVTVTCEGADVVVTDGKFTPASSGTYTFTYTVDWEGVSYEYVKEYELKRIIPEGYLDDFGELSCINTAYVGNASGVKGSSVEWAESHTTSDNVTQTGALKVVLNNANNGQNGYLWLQLNQTTAELEAMNIQSIDITFSAWNEDTNWHGLHIADDNTVPLKSANIWSTAWYTVTITVEQLKSIPRFQKADGEMDWSKLSSDGENTWLIRSNQSTADTLYIDSITYTTAEASAE